LRVTIGTQGKRGAAMLARIAILVALGMGFVAQDAAGQFFRRGPGGGVIVRAPFVNVDVDPYGGTRVRAPFVGVDTPGNLPPTGYGPPPAYGPPTFGYAPYGYAPYGYPPQGGYGSAYPPYDSTLDLHAQQYGPYQGAPPANGSERSVMQRPAESAPDQSALAAELQSLDEEGLRMAIAGAWQRFEESLSRLEDGANWREYLTLPANDSPSGWDQLARRLDSLHRDAQFRRITSQVGFAQLEALVGEKIRRLSANGSAGSAPPAVGNLRSMLEPTPAEPETLPSP
jgi:hypothetical protein